MESDQANVEVAPRKKYQLSRIEVLALLAIVAILVVLLLPDVQSVGSGSAVFPVRVFVFDAVHGVPIEGARVGIIRGYGFYSMNDTTENLTRWPPPSNEPEYLTTKTDEKGVVLIEQEFYTGSSHRHPESKAHLKNVWVLVAADGYGYITIPVSNDPRETAMIREQGEILVPIGLVPLRIGNGDEE